jgi:hypothetical protein
LLRRGKAESDECTAANVAMRDDFATSPPTVQILSVDLHEAAVALHRNTIAREHRMGHLMRDEDRGQARSAWFGR